MIVFSSLGLDFGRGLNESARCVWKAGQEGGARQKNVRPPFGGPTREGEEEVVLDWMYESSQRRVFMVTDSRAAVKSLLGARLRFLYYRRGAGIPMDARRTGGIYDAGATCPR